MLDDRDDGAPDACGSPGPAPRGPTLLVEDSLIIAIDACDLIEEAGLGPVHLSQTSADALCYLDETTPSVAVLDVDLGGETSHPVGERLSRMGVPYALTTGYGADGEPVEGFDDVVVLRKPYAGAALVELVRRLAAG